MTHAAGKLYLLHACGKRTDIIEDLIEDVALDALHSWEDTIEPITDAKRNYGKRLSLLGGIDVDFLTRASPDAIRKRVRETVAICSPVAVSVWDPAIQLPTTFRLTIIWLC